LKSSNPAFTNSMFAGYDQVYGTSRAGVMTVQGTVGKTFGLLGILSATAIYTWNQASHGGLEPAVLAAAGIGGFVLALVTIFKPNLAPWTAPVYAAFEGVFLSALSYLIERGFHLGQRGYTGITFQAVSMTCGTLFVMLFVYGSGLVRVTERLKAGIISATGAVCLVYLISFVVRMFGGHVPFDYASPIGIGFSLIVVGIAAFNLLLDFDFIERGARSDLPKSMEWYGAFGLILTLVWLYLEILQLLRKLQDRR
jgi:uncharacterized YccA/Bax inhibitor family protein